MSDNEKNGICHGCRFFKPPISEKPLKIKWFNNEREHNYPPSGFCTALNMGMMYPDTGVESCSAHQPRKVKV